MPAISQRSFIKVTEVWIPNKTRTRLELSSGIYGDLDGFQRASLDESFAFDEGLPGRCWASQSPVVLKQLTPDNFKRADVAARCGLTCGIAFPVFLGEYVMGVVVFLCGEDGDNLGAIEIWRSQTSFPHDVYLEDGYFGTLADFGYMASMTRFRKGFGLPGLVWEKNMPIILDDLGNSGLFSRAFDASRAKITTALGIPCGCTKSDATVLCLLSSKQMPIALRYEIWTPTADRTSLQIHSSACSVSPRHSDEIASLVIHKGEGAIGFTWLTGLPKATSNLDKDPSPAARSAIAAGLQHIVTVPTIEDGRLKAVVAWYF